MADTLGIEFVVLCKNSSWTKYEMTQKDWLINILKKKKKTQLR